ncbi:MAG: Na+:H+ antiporter, NhaA family [Fimbriimonadaceae bacterium]|nr:Na+:H+ antiporter, NhaA family [Fimbriimonadaceae bacterium]
MPKPLADFVQSEAHSGVVLMAFAIAAIVWANSPWAAGYFRLWQIPLNLGLGDWTTSMSLHQWVNDGLMALFFLLVGLEIKRELLIGELSSRSKAALPVIAALGGMVVPALIYVAFNAGTRTARGWGIPMATDLAFALGALALLGTRVPYPLKVFLAAVAIADDLGAVIVIAIFYTSGLNWTAVGAMALCLIVLLGMNRAVVRTPLAYAAVGLLLWIATLNSGIHATIAGVLLAMFIPAKVYLNPGEFASKAQETLEDFEGDTSLMNEDRQTAIRDLEQACEKAQMPLERVEDALGPWVRFGVMPVFALANAGVAFGGFAEALQTKVALGILLGLVIGKPVGIMLAAWLSVRSGLGALPAGVSWKQLAGVGVLAGIGFTMSLFIANLAFVDEPTLRAIKVAILLASVVAGCSGFGWLALASRSTAAAKAASVP